MRMFCSLSKQQSHPVYIFSVLIIGTLLLLTHAPKTSADTSSTCNAETEVCVDITAKMQGVRRKPDNIHNEISVKASLIREGMTLPTTTTFTMSAQDNDSGLWSGTVVFDNVFDGEATDTSSTFKISLKPPQHLRRVICDENPVEFNPYDYQCEGSTGEITLALGDNELNLTRILFFAGDIPHKTTSGDGVIDSADLVYVRSNLRATDNAIIQKADANMDGIIDTQDFSLSIYTLSIKNIDESITEESDN